MSKKRMRYQWFQEVPRNVNRREYQRLQFSYFVAVGLGATAAMLAFAVVTGLTLQTSRELENTEQLTLEEALAYEGDRLDLVKIAGFVVADDPPTMPDDETRQIIRGELTITARPQPTPGRRIIHRKTSCYTTGPPPLSPSFWPRAIASGCP
jgi:hypothetical protein